MSIEKLNQVWPEWSVEKQLGKGSYGVVYKSVRKDHNLESYAAIKVISIPQDQSEIDTLRSEGLDLNGTRTYLQGIVNDFVSEIQLMESLKGIQNIVSVEDYKVVENTDEIGWDIFIRMELLTPFNTYVSDKNLSESDVIKLGIDICTALEICSKRNIIHRDIKPENIFVNDFGYFKLGDFGIARKLENMTGGLSQKGTFNYMAPEVANSSYYDARVDTYSLGIVLYKLLNGNRLPFLDSEKQLLNPNDRRIAVERRIHGEPLTAPCEASPAMGNLILRACAYDPNQRFATASDMKKALESVANGSYVAIPVDVDATTAVRHAKSDLDGTTAVRRAQPEVKAKQQETFGKKKSKTPKIIAIIAAIAIVVAGAAISVPKLLGDKDNNPSSQTETSENKSEKVDSSEDTVDYSKFDDEQIAAIIEEADALAKNEDYEGAVKKIQTGIATYKDSDKLSAKLDEYNTALTIQKNEKIKSEAISNSEQKIKDNDYQAAIGIIDNAIKQIGTDEDLVSLKNDYSDKYVTDTLSAVDVLVSERKFNDAVSLLEKSITVLPGNVELKSKLESVSSLLSNYIVDPIQTAEYEVDRIEIQKIKDNITQKSEAKKYQIQTIEAGTYRFDLSDVPQNIQFTLYVYNVNMEQLDKEYDCDNGDGITIELEANKTYYVSVVQEDNTGSYTLNIGIQKPIISVEKYTSIHDSTQFIDQKNVYLFNSEENGTYRFDFSDVPQNIQFTLYVYNANMELLDKEYDCDNGDGITINLEKKSQYYIVVEQEDSTGSYTINFGSQKASCDITGYKAVNDSTQFRGQRNCYVYTPESNGTYQMIISNTGDAQFTLYAYNSYMEQLAKQYDVHNGRGLTVDLEKGKTYYIIVEQEDYTGTYSLFIQH